MSRYDIEKFEPPPDPDLVCCICQCVLDKAVESPCRHVFCQACIERWLTNRHTCPTCRKRTRKQDLKPVLPLVQNVLNRLIMKCDYRENGCTEKVVLEQFEKHVQNCGHEMKTCRFSKCGQKILKMHLVNHERSTCEHRESVCEGECGLMIPLSDKCTHNCVAALKAHIEEKNRMIETLKTKLQELNNLSQSLNDQLEQLRQQLDERPRFTSISSFSGSDTDVTDFMSETLSDESLFDENSNHSAAGQIIENNNNPEEEIENNGENAANDVVEQVERTIVTTLFDVSSRLEIVRNQMRAVLDAGVNDNDNLHIATPALDAIVNNNSNIGVPTNANSSYNVNVLDNRNRDNDTGLNSPRHRIMQTLNSLLSSASDNAEHSSEAQDGDVLPEHQTRSMDDAAIANAVYQDLGDADYSDDDQYEEGNSEGNQSDSDLPYTDMYNSHESEDEDRQRSFRFSSHNTSDQYPREDRNLPEHVIVSEPPDSPSNSSFLSSSCSIPSSSSVGDPRDTGTNYDDDDRHTYTRDNMRWCGSDSDWGSDAHTSQYSGRSARYDDNGSMTPVSQQYTPNSSPQSAQSDQTYNNNNNPGSEYDYGSDGSYESGSRRSYSRASGNNSVSDHSYDSAHSVSSSTIAQSESDENVSEGQGGYRSSDNSQYEQHSGRSEGDSTDEYEDPHETAPPVDTGDETDNNKDADHAEKPSADQGKGTRGYTNNEGSDHVTSSQSVMSSASTDDSTHNTSHISIPSDSSDDSDKSIKYLTKRLRCGKKETTDTPAEDRSNAKTATYDWEGNMNGTSVKSEGKSVPESSSDKMKVEYSSRGRHGRKRRAVAEASYPGGPCKKASLSAASYTSLPPGLSLQSGAPSQTVTSSDPRLAGRTSQTVTSSDPRLAGRTSQTVTSSDPRLSGRRTRSATLQAPAATTDPGSQSLNVKIDLSLINYSGQMVPQSVGGTAPSATVTLSKSKATKQEPGCVGDWNTSAPTHRSNSPRVTDLLQNNSHRQTRYPRRRETRSRNPTHSSSPARHPSHGANTRTFPQSWIDNADNSESSDDTYVPGSDCNETDVTISEGEEADSDTSYELRIPKSTADLLNECCDNDSDASWTVGMD